ncbi:uncharacterized protein [Rutidosis leptorrhynchoides]|uniref:uncharacterized protein n=1 Tax=Rutidosis leptorrhynchoides TaxID=125765 RepID=UPI003A991D3D
MKIFNRFRRIFMRFVFTIPSSKGTKSSCNGSSGVRRRSCDRPDPPRSSCNSSYYSSSTHYDEAISDCIEFFKKSSSSSSPSSSQDGCRNLDATLMVYERMLQMLYSCKCCIHLAMFIEAVGTFSY